MENMELTKSVLKLMRAWKRRPVRPGHEVPPAVGRMLVVLKENDGMSPAELCELMDVRPSSMSELLTKMEAHGLIRKESSETDKRATKVFLSEVGVETVQKIESRFTEENAKLASCFTEEELATFITLCNKLSAHVEVMAGEPTEQELYGRCRGPKGGYGPHCGGQKGGRGPRFCRPEFGHGPHFGRPDGFYGPRGMHGPFGNPRFR